MQLIILTLLCFVVSCVASAVGWKYTQPGEGPTGPLKTVTITEEGVSMENMRRKVVSEYVSMPRVDLCYNPDVSTPEYCTLHNKETGFAYVYDVASGALPRLYEKCPGGGHGCWFTEKYDQYGSIVAIENSKGEGLLEKMAKDVWSGNWDIAPFKEGKTYKFDKGQLMEVRGDEDVVVTVQDMARSAYFIQLLINMEEAGWDKPDKFKMEIRNAQDASPYNMIPIIPEPEPEPQPVAAPPPPPVATDVDCTWTGTQNKLDVQDMEEFKVYKGHYEIAKDTEQKGTGLTCDGEVPVQLKTYNALPPGMIKGRGNEIIETYTNGLKDSSKRGTVVKRARV